ncbi:MAG: ATP-binding protein [Acidobacteria bacterium]|nr:ATP-binding protein [Acidobacteriota bacterium]MBI3422908.1 ATP-binding protein [Acidobacteriota bacterium]
MFIDPSTNQATPDAPAEHFRRCFYAAVLRVIEQVALMLGSYEAAFAQFPFLTGYNNELAAQGVGGLTPAEAWQCWFEQLHAWEQQSAAHLPLRAVCEAAQLDDAALSLWLSIGLAEEDARFGALFAAQQGTPGQHRATVGLLNMWWSASGAPTGLHTRIRHLEEHGLIQIANREAPRSEWTLQVPGALWDALRGEQAAQPAAGLRYHAPAELLPLEQLLVPDELRAQLAQLPALLRTGQVRTVLLRGPEHNGRKTLLGTLARQLGRGVLVAKDVHEPHDARWRWLGPLATALHALPVLSCEPAPGETAVLPELVAFTGPLGVVLGQQGGVSGAASEHALTLTLPMPEAAARLAHWQSALPEQDAATLTTIAERYRLTGGNIRRAAQLASACAALDGRAQINLNDVQQAGRTLNRQALDTLATRLNVSGDWNQLAANTTTLAELHNLTRRCRQRERLLDSAGAALGAQLNAGVRALFCGPSGTGKTLAARLLAATLHKDLYRLDLAAIVNKYIGETEKGLQRLFARAEELDVILLLDEGDALLTQRTNVTNANDRYANLETNYLLQRLETFEGILIVTTNAAERIDSAFQRRMDVVVDFRLPDAAERLSIWQLHLPEANKVEAERLLEIAGRCALTGGQVRNAALHAALLALDEHGVINTAHLEAAVQREYRKAGAVCPLRSTLDWMAY